MAKAKYENFEFILKNTTNPGTKIMLHFRNTNFLEYIKNPEKTTFKEKFKILEDYEKFIKYRDSIGQMMSMFNGADLSRVYYKLFDNGKGEIWTQISLDVDELK